MEKKELRKIINRFLAVDGTNVKAVDVVAHVSHAVLIALVAYLIFKSEE